jgi:ferredoxin
MPTVIMKSDNKTVQCEPGTPLIDVCKRENASVPFSCQNGVCGTCIIKVNSGLENLSPIEEKEKNTLQMFGAGPEHRLACQCKVNGDVEFEDL